MSRALAAIALLLTVATLGTYAWLVSLPIPKPMHPVWYLGALVVATVLAAVAVVRSRRWFPISALAVSVIALAFAGYFNFVIARVPPPPRPALVVGQPAPDFTLPDAAGRPVRLADYRGQKPVVLVFYRGYW